MNWHSAGTPPIGFVARRRETTEEQIEHEVVAAISAIPGWDYEKVIRRPLTGGLMNSNWLLTYEGVTYFLKMFGKGSESFVDRRLSNEAAVKANALGISPRVELFDPEALIELFEFLDLYRPSTAADFMIERYYGEVRQELVSRVWVARAVSDMKWGSWAVQQRKLSSWDFDYQKYGIWKYARARTLFNDPRWNDWLREI